MGSPLHKGVVLVFVTLLLTAIMYGIDRRWKRRREKKKKERMALGEMPGSVYCGRSSTGEDVYIKPRQRAMHTQVVGTTNAGKTESVILPWAIQDIRQGRGLILIDGKSDRGLLEKLWAYTLEAGRSKDFRLFSLGSIPESVQFNPLLGGSPEEVAERVFNSFEFENPYYRSVQFEIFSQVLRIFADRGICPTFLRLHQAISNPKLLYTLAKNASPDLKTWAESYRDLSPGDVVQRTSGLTSALSQFAFGGTAVLFNTEEPAITIEKAFRENLIVYFQLPVLLTPFLGKASGKMILQSIQSAMANRHRSGSKGHEFFSIFLDDFSEYLYPGFVSVLNKSRSANVGIVFAHQALGDMQTLGDAVANSILTNANLKVFMRGNDPTSAEYFSKVIGTVRATKFTERTRKDLVLRSSTGEASAREVEEFIVHPNRFKSELGVGEAVMVVPHDAGSKIVEIKFDRFEDMKPEKEIESVAKATAPGLNVPAVQTPDVPIAG